MDKSINVEEFDPGFAAVQRLAAEARELRAELDTLRSEIARLREERDRFERRVVDYVHALDQSRAENERLRAALGRGRGLVEDMDEIMPSQATEDEDGFIASYRIPVGPWHRLLGWARGSW